MIAAGSPCSSQRLSPSSRLPVPITTARLRMKSRASAPFEKLTEEAM